MNRVVMTKWSINRRTSQENEKLWHAPVWAVDASSRRNAIKYLHNGIMS